MTSSQAVQDLKGILNRPEEDDLFDDPDDYLNALERAQNHFRRKIAQHYPDLLIEEPSAISSEGGDGEVYDLGADHLGEMLVWTPPGPPSGDIIPEVYPESTQFGYYMVGQKLHLTHEKDYDPGIYLQWIPASKALDASTDPSLPSYFDDALLYQAAFYLASTPGFLGDPNYWRQQAVNEWEGDPQSVSDSGLLGVLSRQSAHHGLKSRGDRQQPWYKNIPGSG